MNQIMKPKPLKPVHCIGFLFFACAEYTDGALSKDEEKAIMAYLSLWSPKSHCDDFDVLIKKIKQWYLSVKKLDDNEIQKEINTCINDLNLAIGDPFDIDNPNWKKSFRLQRTFFSALIEVTKADGKIIKEERLLLKKIAKIWGIADEDYEF